MWFKVIKKSLLFLSSLAAPFPLGFVLACSNDKQEQTRINSIKFTKFLGFDNLIKNYRWKNKSIIRARIVYWKDGDTFDYEEYDPTTNGWIRNRTGQKLILRIAFIDTPEYHDPQAQDRQKRGNINPIELKWARAATEWAKAQIPLNTEIRIWKQGTDAYGRVVGSVFYNQANTENGFKHNFAVNIIRAGYTFPRIASKSDIIIAKGDEAEILNYLALPLYEAWKEATTKAVNLYGLKKPELVKAYQKHGIPTNYLNAVEKIAQEWLLEPTFLKYKIYQS